MNRRRFVQASISVAAYPAYLGTSALGRDRNELTGDLKISVIGLGSWGGEMLAGIPAIPGVARIDLCEIHPDKLSEGVRLLSSRVSVPVKGHRDIDSLFFDQRPHVALIATPDHVRGIHAIQALRHGAHVMTGECAALSPSENESVLKAAGRRQVQLLLPHRREAAAEAALSFLKEGRAGEISAVRAYATSSGRHPAVVAAPASSMPPSARETWSGGVPLMPDDEVLMDGAWRHSQAHSLGVIGEHGIPLFDFILQWSGGVPEEVYATGGMTRGLVPTWSGGERPACPDYLTAHFKFAKCPVTWEHRHMRGSGPWCRSSGIYFHGSRGLFHLSGNGSWTFTPERGKPIEVHREASDPLGDVPGLQVLLGFIQRLRAGGTAYPDLETANRSSLLAMLALRSFREGVQIQWAS